MKAWQEICFKRKPWVTKGWKQTHKITRLVHVEYTQHKNGKIRTKAPTDKIVLPQATGVFARFGGARGLMRALKAIGRPRNAASIYKWSYPYPKGTGGMIPASAWKDVLLAAKHEGILLKPDDVMPTSRPIFAPHTPPPRKEKKGKLK